MQKKFWILTGLVAVLIFTYLVLIKTKTTSNIKENESISKEIQNNVVVHGDNNTRTMTTHIESKQIHKEYSFLWSFYSGLMYASVIDSVENTVLIYAHDGQISGYHEDEYLYGVDKSNGDKKWVVYGGFYPIKYCIDDKSSHIYISNLSINTVNKTLCLEIQSLDIETGTEQWKIRIPNINSLNDISLSKSILVIEYIDIDNNKKLLSINSQNGQTNWEVELEENEYLYTKTRELPSIVIQGEDYLKAIDPLNQQEIWCLKGEIIIPLDRYKFINSLSKSANTILEWVIYNNELILLDITNGNIKNKLLIKDCQNYYYLNNKIIYVLTEKSNILFSEELNDLVYLNSQKCDKMQTYNNCFIYINNNKISCYSIEEETDIWFTEIGFSDNNEKCIELFCLKNQIYVMSNRNIYTFEAATGNSLGKLSGCFDDNYANNLSFLPSYINKITTCNDLVYIPRHNGYVDCFGSGR